MWPEETAQTSVLDLRKAAGRALRRARKRQGWTEEHATRIYKRAFGTPGNVRTLRRWEAGDFEQGYPVIILLGAANLTQTPLEEMLADEPVLVSLSARLDEQQRKIDDQQREIEGLKRAVVRLEGPAPIPQLEVGCDS
jgi:transcriptional regulator with XRE-family HTH domain